MTIAKMTRKSNQQDLLKFIAIILMIVDHIGLYFFPDHLVMRAVGRYSFPIFFFFAGYNFKQKPRISVLLYGLVLYGFTSYLIIGYFVYVNVLISIFLGQIYLYFFKDYFKNFSVAYIHFVIMAVLYPVTENIFEYGSMVIGIMVLGYHYRYSQQRILIAFAVMIVSLFQTMINFYDYFSLFELIMTLITSIAVFLSLSMVEFSKEIKLKLTPITNHLALIYALNLIIITFIWRYYIII